MPLLGVHAPNGCGVSYCGQAFSVVALEDAADWYLLRQTSALAAIGSAWLAMTSPARSYDVVVIGGGHNGLTCAAYLGMAGLRVKIFERRHVVGGAAVTEEFYPGFRNSVAAYTVSLLDPKIIRYLRLPEHGLRIVERWVQNFVPAADGRYLLAVEGQTERQIAKFSAADASRYAAFSRELDMAAGILRDIALRPPP